MFTIGLGAILLPLWLPSAYWLKINNRIEYKLRLQLLASKLSVDPTKTL